MSWRMLEAYSFDRSALMNATCHAFVGHSLTVWHGPNERSEEPLQTVSRSHNQQSTLCTGFDLVD